MADLSLEEWAVRTEIASERKGVNTKYCNFTLRPLCSEQEEFYPHRAMVNKLMFMQVREIVYLREG